MQALLCPHTGTYAFGMSERTPDADLCEELAKRLRNDSRTDSVRKLRAAGFGGTTAAALLNGDPKTTLKNAVKAAAIIGLNFTIKKISPK